MKNWAFYRSLHGRGLNTTRLAAAIGSSRAHVTEVLNNKTGHGHFTRRKLLPFLTASELQTLGWTKSGDVSAGDGGANGGGQDNGLTAVGELPQNMDPTTPTRLDRRRRSTRNIVPALS